MVTHQILALRIEVRALAGKQNISQNSNAGVPDKTCCPICFSRPYLNIATYPDKALLLFSRLIT